MKRLLQIVMIFSLILCCSCKDTLQINEKRFTRLISQAEKASPNRDSSLSERYGIPKQYQSAYSFAKGKVSLNIDAIITIPDVQCVPILKAKKACFSQPQTKALFNALSANHTWWYRTGDILVRSEIEQEIKSLRESLLQNSGGETSNAETRLSHLERIYEAAPESTRCIGMLAPYETINSCDPSKAYFYWGIDAYCTETTPEQTFRIINSEIDLQSKSSGWFEFNICGDIPPFDAYENDVEIDDFVREDIKKNQYLSMLPEDAITLANHFLCNAGLSEDFQIAGIYLASEPYFSTTQYCYRILCGRLVNGVMVTPLKGASGEGDYWEYETIDIKIIDDGIIRINWNSPLSIVETVIQDAKLLPFQKIVDCFTVAIDEGYAPFMQDNDSVSLQINKITLSLQRICNDSDEFGLLIPVWNFYSTGNQSSNTSDEGNPSTWIPPFQPTISINAIDGSVIDIARGY